MRSIKKVIVEDRETLEIKGLVEVYEEIAAGKMQEIRESIMNARDFFERLATLSSEVGADLETAGLGRTGDVAVFVSAGTGLYGDLIDRIFVGFMDFVQKNPRIDKVVIGKLGDEMMKFLAKDITYQYYDLVDEEIEAEKLSMLIKDLVRYKKIYLFYGKFRNIVNQETWTQAISGQVLGEIQGGKVSDKKFLYLYEPGVESVAKVFSEEIAGSVFDNTIEESRLAKYASRLMHLDTALEKINEKLKNLFFERIKVAKRVSERKQLASFAGLLL
ncbi:MAG: F0F1 ATP synthase subunit gamma [Patescibacteria group bacterium]